MGELSLGLGSCAIIENMDDYMRQPLYERLRNDLHAAQKQRNHLAVQVLKSTLSRIDNASAVHVDVVEADKPSQWVAGATSGAGSSEVPRRVLTETEMVQLIELELDELLQSIDMLGESAPTKYMDDLRIQTTILSEYISK